MEPVFFLLIFFVVVGIPLVFFFLKKVKPQTAKYDVQSTGKILDKKPYEKGIGVYYVLLEYTYEGQTYREYTRTAANPGPWNNYLELGSVIRIFINSQDPTDVYCSKYINGMGSKTR